MLREVQVRCMLLGICAQCLTHKGEGHRLDFVWGRTDTQCPRMTGQHWTWDEWRRKFGAIGFNRLYNSVGVVEGRVVLSPWLAAHQPRP